MLVFQELRLFVWIFGLFAGLSIEVLIQMKLVEMGALEMTADRLSIYRKPKVRNPRMLIGFSGWMDGGEISTGTMKYLIDKLDAKKFACIESNGFYICNFPGPMELSSVFRPHTEISDGIVESYKTATNEFFYDARNDLIIFLGKEPNIDWEGYGECIFSLCSQLGVSEVYYIGSVAGLTPHTRDPVFHSSVSDEKLKAELDQSGMRFTNYDGPASIVSYLLVRARMEGVNLVSMVAEIPAYVQGYNARGIEAAIKHVTALLNFRIRIDDLHLMAEDFEKRLNRLVEQHPKLAETINKLEQDYDEESA